jgi:hypothetical protein
MGLSGREAVPHCTDPGSLTARLDFGIPALFGTSMIHILVALHYLYPPHVNDSHLSDSFSLGYSAQFV